MEVNYILCVTQSQMTHRSVQVLSQGIVADCFKPRFSLFHAHPECILSLFVFQAAL